MKFKHIWEVIACELPSWAVGWYWRRELRRTSERLFKAARDPRVIELTRALPPAWTFCRTCGHSWGKAKPGSEPCEHA